MTLQPTTRRRSLKDYEAPSAIEPSVLADYDESKDADLEREYYVWLVGVNAAINHSVRF